MVKKIDFQFKSPSESPGFLLAQLTTLWQRKQKRALDPLDLTHTQFVILASLGWLEREKDAVTQVDIARQSNFDRMMVSKVLRTLQKKNYVSRQEHEKDSRAKIIKLTNTGGEVLQKAIKAVEDTDIEFFSLISADLPGFNRNMLSLINGNFP